MSDQKQQVPSVGRVVHYVAYGTPGGEFPAGAHRAAIITEVYFLPLPEIVDDPVTKLLVSDIDPSQAGLCVLNPTGLFFHRNVPFDPTGETPGTWHWPEYVPAKA